MISVVIPLYNKEEQIALTLQSVLQQTYQDFEIVIVNDGSTDNSVTEVERLADSRIRLIHQPNAGVSAARNRGIEEARSELIAFLDADDEWEPEYLQTILHLRNKYTKSLAWGTSYINSCNGYKTPIILNGLPFLGEDGVLTNYFKLAVYSHPPICSISIATTKQLLEEIGGFPVGVKSGEDLLTWARLATKTDIAYSIRNLAIYNIRNGYDLSNLPPRRQDDNDVVGKELVALYHKHPQIDGLRKYISHWHKMRASAAIRYDERRETIYEVLVSLKYNPLNIKVILFFVLALLPKRVRHIIISQYK